MNAVYREQVRPGGVVPDATTKEENERREMTDKVLQNYFREANRTVDIKIFKAQIKHKKQPKPTTIYFVNRLEVGQLQTPERLD